MAKRYSTKQLQEAVSYWRGVLKGGSKAWAKAGRSRLQITEAVEKWESELNERELSDKEVGLLASYIEKNKVDVAGMLKLEKVDDATAKKDDKVKAAYDELKKAAGELKFSNKSIPAFHRALKAIFKGKEAEAKDPKKAAEAIKAEPEKVEKALEPVKAEGGEAKGGDDSAKAAVDPKTEKAVEKKLEDATPEDIGAEDSEEAAEQEATSKPIGEMNLMDRLRRLHNATVKNVIAKLKKFLPFAKGEQDIEVENSCVENGQFTIPDDGNMFITVKVKVNDANRKGFKKFIGGMFGKAMNETDEEILEGVIGNFFGGLWKGSKEAAQKFAAGAKEGAEKAAQAYKDNLSKVNDEMKKRIGVAAIQEYVTRFCGKALAKKVNYQVIQVAIENEGTEDVTYVFTGCIKVTK